MVIALSYQGTREGNGAGPGDCPVGVDKHQGEIFFETEEGRGTTFIVRLPMPAAARARVEEPVGAELRPDCFMPIIFSGAPMRDA